MCVLLKTFLENADQTQKLAKFLFFANFKNTKVPHRLRLNFDSIYHPFAEIKHEHGDDTRKGWSNQNSRC